MTLAAFSYKMFSVTAEGFAEDEMVPVEINTYGEFRIDLPHYVSAITGTSDVISPSLTEAIEKYGKACEQYQAKRLLPGAGKKVLLVQVSSDYDMTGADIAIAVMHDTEIDGRLLKYEGLRDHMIVLPYTPETEAKLFAMRDSIRIAGELLEDFSKTADPVAYLHAIQFAGQPDTPAEPQMELPLVASDEDDL